MRRLLVAALLTLAAAPATAGEPYAIAIDWHEGEFLVATRIGVEPVDRWSQPFTLDACRRALILDLLYEPDGVTADVDGVGEATLAYEFRAETWAEGAMLGSTRIRSSSYGHPLGTAPEAGSYELRLFLVAGVDVSWAARLRAREIPTDLACLPRLLVNEVEANPAGADAGAEWVELHNPGSETVDASFWILRWGAASVTLAGGTTVAPGGRLVVEIPSSTPLPEADLVLALDAAFGYLSDETPPLADAADDGRTQQRTPEGGAAWSFGNATRGQPNT